MSPKTKAIADRLREKLRTDPQAKERLRAALMDICDCGGSTKHNEHTDGCETAFREMVTAFVADDDTRARALAHECGVSFTTVLRWEAGLVIPHTPMRKPVMAAIERLRARTQEQSR